MRVIITKGNTDSKITAFACVITDQGIKIPGFKIQECESGQTVIYPPSTLRGGKFINTISFSTREAKTMYFESIFNAYDDYKLSNDEE